MATPADNQQDRFDKAYQEGRGSYSGPNLRDQESNVDAPVSSSDINSAENSSWKDNTSPRAGTGKSGGGGKWRGKLNKKSSLGILGLFTGGGALLMMLLTPALGIPHLKEVLVGDLNDQLAAVQSRSNHVLSAQLKKSSSGLCTSKLSIRCKFSSMSNKQVKRFANAGFKMDSVQDLPLGRKRIVSMTAPDGTVINSPNDLRNALIEKHEVRTVLRRAYNPKFYSLSDKVANKVFNNFKTNKQKKITGSTDEERRQSLGQSTSGEGARGATAVRSNDKGDYVIDEQGNEVYKSDNPDKFEKARNQTNDRISKRPSVGGKSSTGVLRAGVAGLSIMGASDTACTVYNTSRAIEATAKIVRSQQLAQFAMVLLVTADSIKAGDATPEEVNFVGNMLTKTDTRKEIVNETSTITSKDTDELKGSKVPNPFYGKSAFDSPGYRVAAYNEAPVLTSQSQQYMTGGALGGTFAGVNKWVDSAIPGSRDDKRAVCKTVQNPFVRGAGLVAGVFAAIGSFGIWTAVQVGGSFAIGFAMPFLEASLADMLAGKIISPDIAGVEAGDAAFAGTSALMGEVAKNRGMQPLNKDGIESYIALSSELNREIAIEDAQENPFDIHNRYTFLGSIFGTLYPSMIKVNTGGAGIVSSLGSLVSAGFRSIVPSTHASQGFNEKRFSQCNDEGYAYVGIDADIFCNVRYGFTNEELSLDPDVVVEFMLGGGYIDDDGTPKGEYKNFIENCVERADGWGETSSEDTGSLGRECIDGNKETMANISYFRVFTMDNQIVESMMME